MTEGSKRLFGTDGVRGRAYTELTSELAYDLARAVGEHVSGHVVIGRDTRESGPMLVSAMTSGFNAVGVDVIDLGVVPAGAVSFFVVETGAEYGVVVSASHNPAEDNGIKFFNSNGRKLSDNDERSIEQRYFDDGPYISLIGSEEGAVDLAENVVESYVESLLGAASLPLDGIECVIDAANGAAFRAAPLLFNGAGAAVEVIADNPDGLNINAGVGATNPEAVMKVASGRIGLAFDGDADRLIAVDEDGRVVDGDVIMAIFAEQLLSIGELKKNTVVATVMSNLGFIHAMEGLGIDVVVTPVGDRNVVEAMEKVGAVVGGEQSGHVLLEDRTTGDGLRTAMRLMEIVVATGRELRDLRTVMTELPQVLENVSVRSRDGLGENEAISSAIATAENDLGSRGRVLVRASGTEHLIRVMVEAPSEEEATLVAGLIAEVVRDELG